MKTRPEKQLVAVVSSGRATVDVALLESLFDQAPDVAFFIKDAAGRYRVVNTSLVERHGLRHKSQVLGKRPSEICPGEFGRIPAAQDAAVLRTGRPLLDHLELHWSTPHKPGWCLTTKLPMRDAAGKIIGLIGISRDVRAPIGTREIPVEFAAALEHFENHLAEPVTPSALARRAQLAPPRFARLMKRFFGLTPSQFIAKTRVAAASRLLRETDQTVAAIALACGFYDHSAFTRTFRALTGGTPAQFRAGGSARLLPRPTCGPAAAALVMGGRCGYQAWVHGQLVLAQADALPPGRPRPGRSRLDEDAARGPRLAPAPEHPAKHGAQVRAATPGRGVSEVRCGRPECGDAPGVGSAETAILSASSAAGQLTCWFQRPARVRGRWRFAIPCLSSG